MNEVTEKNGSLPTKQKEMAYAMVRSPKTLDELLGEFGISDAEFTEWVLDGRFTEYTASVARGYAEADLPYVWKVLQGLVQSGGISAIRLYFDLVGKKPPVQGEIRSGNTDLTGLRERIFCEPEEGSA